MAEIINLRLARKVRARAQAEAQAQTNRAYFGQTKAEKRRAKDEAERLTRTVEGAKLEKD
jgi:hypothetical protein